MTDSLLVVGLGNPGPGYAGNRHNVGKMVLDQLADRFGGKFKSHKAGAQVAEVRTAPGGPKLILAKPTSYMNVSGRPVSGLLSFYSLTVESLLVVHDELDLPFDSLRLKVGGGHGGHNGLRDIIAASGSPDFTRLRFGIGRPPGQMDVADFVLKDFSSTERKVLDNLLVDSADAVEDVATKGVLAAQQRLHSP